MNLEKALLQEHSKHQTIAIAKWIGNDKERFEQIVNLFKSGNSKICQRAAWVLGYIEPQNLNIIKPHLFAFLNMLDLNVQDAVKRNIVKTLESIDIPENLIGIAADKCFKLLASPDEAIAIKVYCMSVLYTICKKEPELKNELKLLIEEELRFGGAAIKSRGNKILNLLKKFK